MPIFKKGMPISHVRFTAPGSCLIPRNRAAAICIRRSNRIFRVLWFNRAMRRPCRDGRRDRRGGPHEAFRHSRTGDDGRCGVRRHVRRRHGIFCLAEAEPRRAAAGRGPDLHDASRRHAELPADTARFQLFSLADLVDRHEHGTSAGASSDPKRTSSAALTGNARSYSSAGPSGTQRGGFGTTAQSSPFRPSAGG